ncbi:SDR family NAD(P)-dependent oxidoreductase [Parahaliea mediterranea]|uniref:SDR family NAD(P)-dependent oxidoreductase n=1 Tax=Parahaliea mediterranea TaxID=651086 RepID=A0A939DF62_9GAMM|nr:SDR family NAD(P)-dependent oxidoreductase [Parahaliea mediterranea]MBN7797076.1 SDR family NAD(P)-dependent oxidoreductase [Parahaliea mediterranea]
MVWSTQAFGERYGPWAVVTGASAGIGREFARQLADLGLNLLLVARREPELAALARDLQQGHGILARVLATDLSQAEGLAKLLRTIDTLEVGLLVNNAGAPSFHGHFASRTWSAVADTLYFNTQVQLRLIHHLLPSLLERGRGGIIQVSSITGHTPVPYMAEYAACKAYQLALGESLHVELRDRGVDVLVLSPGATRSERVDFGMHPRPVARAAINGLGKLPSVVPGRLNRWSAFRFRHLDSRRRALWRMGRFQSRRLEPAGE